MRREKRGREDDDLMAGQWGGVINQSHWCGRRAEGEEWWVGWDDGM